MPRRGAVRYYSSQHNHRGLFLPCTATDLDRRVSRPEGAAGRTCVFSYSQHEEYYIKQGALGAIR